MVGDTCRACYTVRGSDSITLHTSVSIADSQLVLKGAGGERRRQGTGEGEKKGKKEKKEKGRARGKEGKKKT